MQRGQLWRSAEARLGGRAFALSLGVIWVLGGATLLFWRARSGSPVWSPPLPPILGIFAHWDAQWYYKVAVHGYFRHEAYVFMPLYPMLIHALHFVRVPYMLSGVLLSWAADLLALILLARLWIAEGGEELAHRSIWLLLTFPAAFFLLTAYTESLYLLLSVACFLALRQGRYPLAAVFAALGAVERTNGFFLLIPLLAYAWEASGRRFDRVFWRRAAWGVLPLLALGAYALYSHTSIGEPLAFLTMQSNWHRHYTGITFAMSFALAHILHGNGGLLAILDYLTPATFLAVIALDQGRMPIGDSLYVLVGVLTTLVAPSIPNGFVLMSATRLCMVYFPVVLAAGRLLKNPGWRTWLMGVMAASQVTLWLMFAHGVFAG